MSPFMAPSRSQRMSAVTSAHEGRSGNVAIGTNSTLLTPCMVRPCGARGFVDPGDAVLHQCIRPLIGACAPGHHGYQRACDLITGQASNGLFGSPVFARAGKTDPPSSSHPLADLGGYFSLSNLIDDLLLSLFVRVWRAVPSSRPAGAEARRAQGPVKAGRRAGRALCSGVSRPRLDGPKHGARIKQTGAPSHWS
jgi:hypothetical protein